MNYRHILAAILLVLVSIPASAQITSGLAYYHVDGDDVTVGVLVGSLGYRIPVNDAFSVVPKIRGGFGVKDDTVDGVDVELENLFGAALRLEFLLTESFYVHLTPSYARYSAKASAPLAGGTLSITETSNEFGIGGGLGFRFTRNFSLEANYEYVDGLDIIQIGARFDF